MDFKIILAAFTAIFLAELGDKTQLATMVFSAEHGENKMAVFFGSSAALIVTSALGVFLEASSVNILALNTCRF